MLWNFKLFMLDGTPVVDPASNTQAIAEGMTSTSIGDKSKAKQWFGKLSAATFYTAEEFEAGVLAAVGTKVVLHFANDQKGRPGVLKEIERFFGGVVASPVSGNSTAPTAFNAPPFPAPVAQ